MSNLGRIQRGEGMSAFRVDHRSIPSGTMLLRYYMNQYAQLIDQMQSLIEAGPSSLAQYLTAFEWQRFDLSNKTIGLESEMMKTMVVLEAIFEHARKKFASHLPSRLDCVFVWPTLELAKKFRQEYIPGSVIHRCTIQGDAVELDGGLLPLALTYLICLRRFFLLSSKLHSRALKSIGELKSHQSYRSCL